MFAEEVLVDLHLNFCVSSRATFHLIDRFAALFGALSSSLLNLQFANHSVDNFVNDTQERLPAVSSLIHDFAGLLECHVDLNDDFAYLSKQVD